MSQSDILNAQHQEIAKNTTQLDNFTTEILENDVEDAVTESEPDAEEEIDQLDSDSEAPPEQPQPNVRVPKKPSSSRTSERRPGQALLPTVRIENILQAEGLLGNLNLSKESTFLLSIATEEFIKGFVKDGHQRAQLYNRNMVRYHDMATAAKERYDYNFLRETIPTPTTLQAAFHHRNKREKDLLNDDPAMQFPNGRGQLPIPPSPTPVTTNGHDIVIIEAPPSPDSISSSGLPSSKSKSADCARAPSRRQPSSKPPALAPPRQPPSTSGGKHLITEPSETWEEWKEKSRRLYGTGDNSRQKSSQSSSSLSNDTSSSHAVAPPARDLSDIPRLPPIGQWVRPGSSNHTEIRHRGPPSTGPLPNGNSTSTPLDLASEKPPTWTGPLTGPGSAFLQGPGGPFPRSSPLPSTAPSSQQVPIRSPSSTTPDPPTERTVHPTDDHTG